MTKTYKALGRVVCFNLFVDGVNYNIEFSPVSNYYSGKGGSRFSTDNEILQKALEENPMFGTTYFIETKDGNVTTETKVEVEEEKVVEPELKVVEVSGLEDAKAWLVDNCDWKPTARPTKASVAKVAESFGYRFEGLK